MKKITITVVAILLISLASFAQNIQKSIDDLTSKTDATITLNQTFGIAEFVKFPNNDPLELEGNSIYQKAMTFLETNKGIFNLKTVENAFILDTIKTDQYGFKHVTLLQTHHGVPIYDGKLKFHFNADEKLTAINGNYIPNIKVNQVPSLSIEQASNIAIETVNNQDLNFSGKPLQIKESALYIFQKGLVQGYRGANYLVYRMEAANDTDVREFVFVDAHTGDIIEQFTGIAHALDRVIYEGNTSNIVWQEGDAFPGPLSIWQQNEVVVTGHVYNFFNNTFGHVSYDNADAQMRVINNDPTINCPNANWNGTTINFCDGTASDDILGHEWGHAYTEYTSGLIYAWQSGAINESYSDIWGETIDLINNYEDDGEDLSLRTGCNSSDRWINGEDTVWNGLRDLWDPTCKGDPGKVTDTQYWCSTGDFGGVHFNSGVPNHAYALLVDGGTYNGQTITGIGLTKAAHIFWRAQSQYLTAASDFVSLADALEAACTDLLGINLEGLSTESATGPSGEIITTNDCIQVANVILAVELRTDPGCPDVIPILPPLENELCEVATNNPIFFEDWEAGMENWTLEQVPSNPATWVARDWQISNGPEYNREGNIAFGPAPNISQECILNLQNGIIRLTSPEITMPDNPDATFEMAFNHSIFIESEWDGANLKYSLNSGAWTLLPIGAFIENGYNDTSLWNSDNPLSGEPAFTGTDIGTNEFIWGTSIIDLMSLGVVENSTVQFRFEIGTDACFGDIGWVLDEVMIYNCGLLSTEEFTLENTIKVYPNPSNGIFTLQKTNRLDLLNANIYDINGRIIKTIDLKNMSDNRTIDLSAVASGMYFMSIRTNNSKHVVKLVKK
ncbi:M4 family metallopeptidase [Xanthomarina sp. GH4-25]|uniref:M4 family metallopeptidase n=1 Tax=Xanthomarina sp. GH4-25 TaxID=3349335 RepID=UPI003877E119